MKPTDEQIKQLLALIDMGLTEIRLSDGKRTVVFAPDSLNEDYWSIHIKDGLEMGKKRTDLDLFGFKFDEIIPILKTIYRNKNHILNKIYIMTKEIKMECSKYIIPYDPTKPWSYCIYRNNNDVTDEIRNNVLDDLMLCLAENIENGIVFKGITVK